MNIRIAFLTCVCLMLSACNNDPSGTGPFEVPVFSLGTTSLYSWNIVEVDSLADTLAYVADTLQTNVAAVDDIVGAYSGLIRMEAFSVPHYVGTEKVWYKEYPDGLLEIAYSSAGATPPVLPKLMASTAGEQTAQIRSNGDYIRIPLAVRWALKARGLADSIIERTDKRVVYRYPLEVGSSWTSFTDPFLQVREVEAYETITAGHRAYLCAKIRTTLPTFAPEIQWYDYVAPEGLVKRVIYFPSMVMTSPDNPDGLNGKTVSVTESLLLMD